jgi:methylmalonyl-CoA/ethylmalonyl-CoA epimerase
MAIKRIDHLAIVVPEIGEAKTFYRDALGLPLADVERVDGQEVMVAFFPVGESEIELVEPLNDTSGVARYLEKRGPGIHHICLEVDDIEATLAELKARGVELIDETPTQGSGGKKIAFVHPRSTSGVLIELYESTPIPVTPVRIATHRMLAGARIALAGLGALIRVLGDALGNGLRRAEEEASIAASAIPLKTEGQILDEAALAENA